MKNKKLMELFSAASNCTKQLDFGQFKSLLKETAFYGLKVPEPKQQSHNSLIRLAEKQHLQSFYEFLGVLHSNAVPILFSTNSSCSTRRFRSSTASATSTS